MVRKRSWPAVSCRYTESLSMRMPVYHATTGQRSGNPYPYTKLDFLPLDLHLVNLKCPDGKPPV